MDCEELPTVRQLDPIFVSIPTACRILDLSTVTIYRLIAEGRLACRKAGTKSLIEYASIKSYVESLPAFIGKTGHSRSAKSE